MTKKNLLWTAAFGFLVAVFLFQARADPGAKDAMKAGAKLVDVRTPGEYGAGHLQGALNIPVDELAARIAEIGAKNEPVVVYCRSGKRSARAKGILVDAGFTNVHDLGAMSNGE